MDSETEVEPQTPSCPRLERLGPGDSLIYPGGVPHRRPALGDRDRVRILAVQSALASHDQHPADPSPR
ncbi:hypothetical protein ACFXJ5_13950 [Streptomyces sp. NPDC059373]